MKRAIALLIAVAFAAGFASLAYADTVTLVSYGTNPGNPPAGVNNSAVAFLGYDPTTPITVGVGSLPTYDLTAGLSPWANPIAGSQWVSSDPNSTIGLGSGTAYGYYSYTTAFNATPGMYNGSLGIFADDTAEVFLNGLLLVAFDTNVANGPCAQDGNGPTCIGNPFQARFTTTLGASNVLTIVEWQSNGGAAGIDFAGTLTPIPEPGSLLLLGSGLASLAGFFYRKARRVA